jgi:hypothetical protein
MPGESLASGHALTLPATVAGTVAFVRRRCGTRPAIPPQPRLARAMPEFGGRLRARLLAMCLLGEPLSDEIAPRLSREEATAAGEDGLPVAPHASPLRQVQAARQGAAPWGDAE